MYKLCTKANILLLFLTYSVAECVSFKNYKILSIFANTARSHHIFFSALVEELATRGHEVTVVNYYPVKKNPNLRQINLHSDGTTPSFDFLNVTQMFESQQSQLFTDFYRVVGRIPVLKTMANKNCEKLINNKEVQTIVKQEKFDLVIVEQFVTDCGFAIVHKLQAPVVGITAHTLMPWTYSKLGAPNNPVFVPHHMLATGQRPDLLGVVKSGLINIMCKIYYRFRIQSSDLEIARMVYPDTPDLEVLAKNMSLILLNQYFPLTGSRLYGANVVEVGGLHIKDAYELHDADLSKFLNASANGVVYISFGTAAGQFPRRILEEIVKVLRKFKEINFIWKVDVNNFQVPNNTLLKKWLPQPAILCHKNVKAFISHSGMLSSCEAIHCGVPVISIPIFGDQYGNSKSVVDSGLGVKLDITTLDEHVLEGAIKTVLHASYQKRAKELSNLWRDRPSTPMDTATYWIEYVARHRGKVNLKPPTVDLPLYTYYIMDIVVIFIIAFLLICFYFVFNVLLFIRNVFVNKKKSKRKIT